MAGKRFDWVEVIFMIPWALLGLLGISKIVNKDK